MSILTIGFPGEGRALVVWTTSVFIVLLIHYGLATDSMNFRRKPAAEGDRETTSETTAASRSWDTPENFRYAVAMRSVFAALIFIVILKPLAYSVPLGLAIGAGSALWIRARAGAKGYTLLALEIAGNVALLVVTGITTNHLELDFRFLLVGFATSDERLAVLLTAAAMLVYLGKGATYLVRGILEHAGTMPRFDSEKKDQGWVMTADHSIFVDRWVISVERLGEDGTDKAADASRSESDAGSKRGAPDSKEYRRGRLIGNIERLVVAVLASLGSYPAIAFVLTAKGLVRAKEFENRDNAEYFLVGTLASCASALIMGILFRVVFDALW